MTGRRRPVGNGGAPPGIGLSVEPAEKSIERAVAAGLLSSPKRLPAWLFYDEEGCRLYDRITELPEYYLTRAERSIFEVHADAMAEAAASDPRAGGPTAPLHVAELGAGEATKTQVLLRAIARRQGPTVFLPMDVSRTAVESAARRLAREEPALRVRPVVGHHEEAIRAVRELPDRQLALFIGSSLGNFPGREGQALLASLRAALRPGAALLLGVDLKKPARALLPAYDDSQGVTAAFNKNVLHRINRELGGGFDPERFRHVAVWNEAESRVEMHLESTERHAVPIAALGAAARFERGERIHTESSVKYDDAMVSALFAASGFARERAFLDDAKTFAVYLARAV